MKEELGEEKVKRLKRRRTHRHLNSSYSPPKVVDVSVRAVDIRATSDFARIDPVKTRRVDRRRSTASVDVFNDVLVVGRRSGRLIELEEGCCAGLSTDGIVENWLGGVLEWRDDVRVEPLETLLEGYLKVRVKGDVGCRGEGCRGRQRYGWSICFANCLDEGVEELFERAVLTGLEVDESCGRRLETLAVDAAAVAVGAEGSHAEVKKHVEDDERLGHRCRRVNDLRKDLHNEEDKVMVRKIGSKEHSGGRKRKRKEESKGKKREKGRRRLTS